MKMPMIAAVFLIGGCTKDGGAYICESDEGVFKAQAELDFFSGKVRSYEAVDGNGISFAINEGNSRSFDCIAKADFDQRKAVIEAAEKAKCESARQNAKSAFERAYMTAICDERQVR